MSRCECPAYETNYQDALKKNKLSTRDVQLKQIISASMKKRKWKFKVFLEECKFKLVRDVFMESGAIEVNYDDCWVISWTDSCLAWERLTKMKSFQRINHFPGMNEICKKDLLSHNLKRMKKVLPQNYNFFPLTFSLPDEARLLSNYYAGRKRIVFIIKPDNNCQGEGIDLIKGIPNVKKYRNVVCQKYICKPLLMEHYKFDLRLYVLITSVLPLRIYIYKEGLVRLATIPYKKPNASNMLQKQMHLTNCAINRHPEEQNPELKMKHCKRSLHDLDKLLKSSEISTSKLWSNIDGIIVKTIFSALPTLEHMYRMTFPIPTAVSSCYELLGFDIILDYRGKPYLLEVNRSPSLGASTPFDKELKQNLIKNILNMVLLTPKQIRFLKEEQRRKSVGRLTNPRVTSMQVYHCASRTSTQWCSDMQKHVFSFDESDRRHAIQHIMSDLSRMPSNLTSREAILEELQKQKEVKMLGNFRMLYPVEDDRYDEIRRMSFSQGGRSMDESGTNAALKDNGKRKTFSVKLPDAKYSNFGLSNAL